MTTLFLVRHGRSTANHSGVLAGRLPGVVLDESGQEQAKHAGARLAGIDLAAVVSSPLERTKQTASAIIKATGRSCKLVLDRGLIECDYGDWSGQPLKSLAKQKMWNEIQERPSSVVFPQGESMAAMAHRSLTSVRAWNERLSDGPGPTAWVAVSHGDVIKAILADALGMHLDSFQRINVDPGSISVVSYQSGRAYVLAMNTLDGDLARYAPRPGKGSRQHRPTVGGSTGKS